MPYSRLLLPALFALLSACASAPPAIPDIEVTDAAREGSFSTFVIKPIRGVGHRVDLEQRFNTALRTALTAKGYTEQAQNADLRVIYLLGLESSTEVDIKPVSVGGATYSDVNFTPEQRARLALRILDNHNHDRLLLQALINKHVRDPNISQEALNQAVAKLLADFPSKP
jgi:ribosomal protein S7